MMNSKAKIKVIKKNAAEIYKTPVVTEKNLKQTSASEMISVVSNWVNEFRERRSEETKQAFDRFLAPYPQTGGA